MWNVTGWNVYQNGNRLNSVTVDAFSLGGVEVQCNGIEDAVRIARRLEAIADEAETSLGV